MLPLSSCDDEASLELIVSNPWPLLLSRTWSRSIDVCLLSSRVSPSPPWGTTKPSCSAASTRSDASYSDRRPRRRLCLHLSKRRDLCLQHPGPRHARHTASALPHLQRIQAALHQPSGGSSAVRASAIATGSASTNPKNRTCSRRRGGNVCSRSTV